MRVLPPNRLTKLHYAGLKQWDVEHERALALGDVPGAARFTLEGELPDVEIVLRYDSFDGEVAPPVLAEWCPFEEQALRPVARLEALRGGQRFFC